MNLKLIQITEQAVDFLTNALPQKQHWACCHKVGLCLIDKREDEDEDPRYKGQGGMLENKKG